MTNKETWKDELTRCQKQATKNWQGVNTDRWLRYIRGYEVCNICEASLIIDQEKEESYCKNCDGEN